MPSENEILEKLNYIDQKLDKIGDLTIPIKYPWLERTVNEKVTNVIQWLIDRPEANRSKHEKAIDLIKKLIAILVGLVTLYLLVSK